MSDIKTKQTQSSAFGPPVQIKMPSFEFQELVTGSFSSALPPPQTDIEAKKNRIEIKHTLQNLML